jgi:hypothetical protein
MRTLLHVINFGNAVALGITWHLMMPWVAIALAALIIFFEWHLCRLP